MKILSAPIIQEEMLILQELQEITGDRARPVYEQTTIGFGGEEVPE